MSERVQIVHGDSREVLATLADNSVDSVVTDPPYALGSIVKRFGAENAKPNSPGPYARVSAGFMGKRWDTGEAAFDPAFWAEVLRVLKPGGHVIASGGTRTYHRLGVAIEDGGFEVRDMVAWLYGSGFPKSHPVAKAIDKRLGVEGEYGEPKSAAHAGWIDRGAMRGDDGHEGYQRPWMDDPDAVDRAARRYLPASAEAQAADGWGTALKPALEPTMLARKPLEGTVAENFMRWGVGALNVAACLVHAEGGATPSDGRWPANVSHDGSREVVAAFPDAPGAQAAVTGLEPSTTTRNIFKLFGDRATMQPRGDAGSAARFFYSAKADAMDRLGSDHPTVKPVDWMAWCIRLVTPPGGLVLDPFAGTGTTGVAALGGGFRAMLIEREAEYVEDIRRRIAWANGEGAHAAEILAKRRKREEPEDRGLLSFLGDDE